MDQISFRALQIKLAHIQSLPLMIQSDSMEPVLKTGCAYIVESKSFEQLQEFDIVVFYQGDRLMAHFLWHFNQIENRWQTRSLRYPSQKDTPFVQDHYLGVITQPSISRYRRFVFYAQALLSRSM